MQAAHAARAAGQGVGKGGEDAPTNLGGIAFTDDFIKTGEALAQHYERLEGGEVSHSEQEMS